MTLSSLIFHGVNLFRLDLKGLELLVPNFLDAIEHVIMDSERFKLGILFLGLFFPKMIMCFRTHPSISDKELKRACLMHYSAMVGLPTHFGTSAISGEQTDKLQETIRPSPKLLPETRLAKVFKAAGVSLCQKFLF